MQQWDWDEIEAEQLAKMAKARERRDQAPPVKGYVYENSIPGETAELRLERYNTDHPPFSVQDRDWNRGKRFVDKLYPVPGYEVSNRLGNDRLLWQIMMLKRRVESGRGIRLVMGIPSLVGTRTLGRKLLAILSMI